MCPRRRREMAPGSRRVVQAEGDVRDVAARSHDWLQQKKEVGVALAGRTRVPTPD
jgi:hypothetical protein